VIINRSKFHISSRWNLREIRSKPALRSKWRFSTT
jgi:hypothetical protein